MLLKGAFCTLSQMSCIIKVCSCCLHSSFPGIIPSMHWTTRTCGSSGTGPNTSWPSSRGACFSTTTPNSACLRSARWRRWREPKIVRSRTTSPLRPTETRLHVRPSALESAFAGCYYSNEKHRVGLGTCKHTHSYCYDGHFLSCVCRSLPADLLPTLCNLCRNNQQSKALITAMHGNLVI